MDVLAIPGAVLWLCPECGHGSADRRDERAHLDAHRQLRAFFEEWDAGTATGGTRRPAARWPAAIISAVVGALVLCVSVVVFSRVHAQGDPPRPVFFPGPVPGGLVPDAPPAPPPTSVAPAAPPPAAASAPVPSSPSPIVPRPTAVAKAPTSSIPVPAPAVIVPPTAAPAFPPAPASQVSAGPAASPERTAYLVQLCVLGSCLTI